ncbi:ATP-binding protein [Paenibacillus sp. MMS20-IR301]|uniref:hybrid sensor histidine kinase/response regulator n=1 Tax=Paenibacillus sp. MMS20-IR301 TaxID=2895946 RepID=UPI0028E21F46|nr:ATP-binding protein [Paenibacillus sp. MMS20-IR301]WNS42438.1 ATP-binding protein [Paenibacillus sp. MMS20-IR301]
MKKYWLSIAGSLVLVLLIPLLFILQSMNFKHEMPLARQGIIDLRAWDFRNGGVVKLNGEWELYRGQLLSPEDFHAGAAGRQIPSAPAMIQVPGIWNDDLSASGKDQAKGYATYRLQARIVQGAEAVYGLRTSNIRSASRIFVNGQEIGNSGMPAATASEGKANNFPVMGFASVPEDRLEIIVQVANYSYVSGGIVQPVVLGNQASILNHREFALFIDGVTSFGFILLALFLMMFSKVRESRGVTLYLSLFCISACVYILTHGEKLISEMLPGLPYEIVLKLQLATSTLVYYYLLRYVANSVNYPVPASLIRASKVITNVLLLVSVFIPAYWFSHLEVLLLTWGAISISYVLYVMVQGTRRNPKDRFLMMLGIESLSVVIICYLVSFTPLAFGSSMISYEIVLFGIVQAVIMARQYAASFLEVEQLSRRLQTLDGLKDDFISDTSHELRKPLLGIVNLAQTLAQGAGGAVSTAQKEQLLMIVSTGKRLSALIHDMSDFAKLNHDSLFLRSQAVDLRTSASSIMEVTRQVYGHNELEFRLELPEFLPLLETDEQRLAQILHNLLANAVNYTPQGVITLSAEVGEEQVAIIITDTGQGIAPERLRTIFDAYDPSGPAAQKVYRENGLGLSITQRLVELAGGQIEVQSRLGEGSVFRFTQPIMRQSKALLEQEFMETTGWETIWETAAAVQPPAEELVLPPPGDCCFILVVDHDPVNLQVLVSVLKMEKHTVITASSGAEAISKIQQYPELDLVIADWVTPEMPGLLLCKTIRERHVLSELPILVLMASSRPEDIQAAFEAGANDYLSKPVELLEFKARVQTLLDMRKSIRSSVQAEIAFLQAQIKPHFLYNALNAIISVCPVDPDKATELLLDLSQYLRSSFDFQNRGQTVSIEKELGLVTSYLALEQARFDERLNIEFDVPDGIMGLVPPLSIQPIVENAVNHGLMQKEDGGTVLLSVKKLQGSLIVTVKDDGVGMTPQRIAEVLSEERTEGGIGLRNIQRRLLKMYGIGLSIDSVPGQGTSISYTIPG